jgi:uncharacterized protein YndB with AHSA1/START domain
MSASVTSQVARVIKAPRSVVFRACLDPDALVAWRAPDAMTGHMHSFDGHVGGGYRMSLTYRDQARSADGKTSAGVDTFVGRFVELVANEKIVEVVEFESPQSRFAGPMTITTRLKDVGQDTEITMFFENLPPGVQPEDNDEGARQSLRKLAALVEA